MTGLTKRSIIVNDEIVDNMTPLGFRRISVTYFTSSCERCVMLCLFGLRFYIPVNNFSIISVEPVLTMKMKCLAQGNNSLCNALFVWVAALHPS